jgi:hypothetical protein
MFKSKTVFVVGAGASCELGFPTGETLKKTIADKLNFRFEHGHTLISGDWEVLEALHIHAKTLGIERGLLSLAGHQCSKALPQAISIDNYLEAHADRPESVLCGKVAIVASILEAEKASPLCGREPGPNWPNLSEKTLLASWLTSFMRLVTSGVTRVEVAKVFDNISFVIFNYDRCIEEFLYLSLQNYYHLQPEEAADIVNGVEFFHPYGTVGRLPWQKGNSIAVQYGAEVSPQVTLALAEGIKTFTEQVDEPDLLNRTRERLAAAGTVVYLGFAFHEQNMKLLQLESVGAAERAYGTAYGFSQSDRAVLMQAIVNSLNANLLDVQAGSVELASIKCAGLFSEYSRSISQ